jgi:hypothetical protein
MADFITKQVAGTIFSAMTTGLNSLANNGLVLSSATTLTETDYLYAEVELVVTYGSAPTANTAISIWFLRVPDGTNYEDGDASTTPVRAADVVLPLRAVTTAQRIVAVGNIPYGNFKILLKNDGTGQTMAASGNTLKIKPITIKAFSS